MADKELLESAAETAGIDLDKVNGPVVDGRCRLLDHWNPLTSDGDALRLAVKLKLRIEHFREFVVVQTDGVNWKEYREHYNDDPYAATRRAIVRAAAELGKAME